MDRGAWWATVHETAKSGTTQLTRIHIIRQNRILRHLTLFASNKDRVRPQPGI